MITPGTPPKTCWGRAQLCELSPSPQMAGWGWVVAGAKGVSLSSSFLKDIPAPCRVYPYSGLRMSQVRVH